MKKLISALMVLIIIILGSSCESKGSDEVLSQIYELKTEVISSNLTVNYRNVASSNFVYTSDPNVEKDKTIQIADKEYTLKYKETRFNPIGEQHTHIYDVISEPNDRCVMFREDGSVCAILCPNITILALDKTDSSETVLNLLKNALPDLIDYDGYQYMDVSCTAQTPETGFCIYDFMWYNMIDGYLTNFTKIYVDDTGHVGGYSCIDFDAFQGEHLNIDKEYEQELISQKLKDMYQNKGQKYQGFKERLRPQLTVYDGKLVVFYTLDVTITEGQFEDSELCQILIPVDLLT